ncbi:MAG: inward rectifier potassium channel [Acidobacteriota bacterium]|jgi:inward rectifier potassium channel|nr:inward rectifier potassium channel [Acidobacteriota bacterium]
MTAVDERLTPQSQPADDPNADLGFGAVVARESRQRLLNRDGTFNVRRAGLRFWQSLSAYHYLLTITWSRFLSYVIAGYIVTNALFAGFFTALGENALTGAEHLDPWHRYLKAFFFSVHTLGTIGYGNVVPATLGADIVVAVEALVGLLSFALITGIVFARFSRPIASIVFSSNAVIAPYRDGLAVMFRIVNKRSTQLVDLRAKVMLSRRKKGRASGEREFLTLKTERDRVAFFPLSWTIVHPIDEESPMHGWNEQELRSCGVELLVLLNGYDETFSQTVHTRSSYTNDEIVWGARFQSMFLPMEEDGVLTVDIRKLDEIERVAV